MKTRIATEIKPPPTMPYAAVDGPACGDAVMP